MRSFYRRHSALVLVTVALVLRLGSVAAQYMYHLNPAADHWRFGWEMGRVGRALYEGRGFSSPMYQPSGATAWMAPVYPALIAIGFRIFGLYTAAAAWFILSLNALFGALTALPVRSIARQIFATDESPATNLALSRSGAIDANRVAEICAWVWVLLPYSIYVCGERIWENTLTTLLAAVLLMLTYIVERRARFRDWLLWSACWAGAALTNPSLLTPLPFIGLWLVVRHHRAARHWMLPAVSSALLFWLLIAPWMLRNERVFHRFIPMRDNFWLEVHVGNNGDTRHPCPDAVHPSNSAAEREQWNRLGELAYMDAKKVESRAYIRTHPAQFFRLSLRRCLFVWTAFWSTSAYYLDAEPMEYFAVAYFTTLTLLAAAGILRTRRTGLLPRLWPMLWFLLIYPLPYYFTHPSYDYRHAMDPILVILATYAIAALPASPLARFRQWLLVR
jgi:hypothetical protein